MTMSTTAPSAMPAEYGFREADDPQGKRVIITPRPYGGAVTDLLFWARRAGQTQVPGQPHRAAGSPRDAGGSDVVMDSRRAPRPSNPACTLCHDDV